MERILLRKERHCLDCGLKKLDVTLIQETHSEGNEAAWRKEWPGQLFLSHKLSTSAGVVILFSRTFNPQDVESHHGWTRLNGQSTV